jgi:hypothetical protein
MSAIGANFIMDMKILQSQESRHEGAIYHACAISLFKQYNGNSIEDSV